MFDTHGSYQPSFKRPHNEIKTRCLVVLYYMQKAGESRRLTARQLADRARVKLDTLRVLLIRWNRWGYVTADRTGSAIRYGLGANGYKWIGKWQDLIRKQPYMKEINVKF